ncbi:pyruvate kinase [uncultured Martelella sp.]|uniref:pyruvate kinase n=1 Tax=uncultured Martelella sp. TaxID=392331 RepID=UPI0029C7C3E4|nr:pyruvate kinase [uncultured Martelella sp.]
MVAFEHFAEIDDVWGLTERVESLRELVTNEARAILQGFGPEVASQPGVVNLAHYLALRHHDVRPLQRALMRHGLSSLGRLESRVLPTLDAVLVALAARAGRPSAVPLPSVEDFFAGEERLEQATDLMFGPPPVHRRSRIMVTLATQAADDPAFVADLVRRGMDIARINCAHDGPEAWRAMANHVRAAGDAAGRRIAVLMDIAGPKIRTEKVALAENKLKANVGDRIRLIASGEPSLTDDIRFCVSVSLPEMVTRLKVGDRVLYDDGKLQTVVTEVADGMAVIRVERAKAKGARLKPEKGLNLPDTALGLSPLTAKDEGDISTVIECADMVGYSFVSRPEDLDLLDRELGAGGNASPGLGVVAKIERPEAVKNLPALIARAAGRREFAVMIARGDLAAEIGFERLAEMQEEILWICEAAGVPVIWATQVLENLVKTGVPSRGEMTDAAMGVRAECVMLNKGDAVCEGVSTLDTLLARMDEHMFKKTPELRALKSW